MPELEGLSHVPLILASASRSRGMILREAGLQFTQKASLVDEEPIKKEMAKKGESPTATAARLARAKAEAVSDREPTAVVIGADQILALGDELFDKPTSME
ncbi:MAG: Maf family protein, partial [Alphaproteobacteria bacterium]|nr:Maf family protein [Alphaproteobacteria bacterium]